MTRKSTIDLSPFNHLGGPQYIKRLRLNGNFTKAEMLHAAIISYGAHFIKLEYCWNLDEECLEAILDQLCRVTIVLLKGTSLTEDSDVIKRLREKRKEVIFISSDVCKCCGTKHVSKNWYQGQTYHLMNTCLWSALRDNMSLNIG